MAVLIEAISVVVRRAAIDARYPGGWEQFVKDCPNQTLCADDHIARVGFMSPSDAELFVERLVGRGLVFVEDGTATDIATVDQHTGPLVRVQWLETGRVSVAGHPVTACRFIGDSTNAIATPDGWAFAGSLSDRSTFVPSESASARMTFVRHENGCDVFLDRETGQLRYVGRTGVSKVVSDPTASKRGDVN